MEMEIKPYKWNKSIKYRLKRRDKICSLINAKSSADSVGGDRRRKYARFIYIKRHTIFITKHNYEILQYDGYYSYFICH